MINMFNSADQVTLGHKLSIASAQALSGRQQSQRRGPYLYAFTLEMNNMSILSDRYHLINSDLREINYGVDTSIVTIPHGIIPDVRGSFDGSPIVNGASQTGRTIQMNGFGSSKTNVVRDGDFLKFSNSSKVFQAVGDYDSNSVGEIIASGTTNKGLVLNTPVVVSPVSGSSLNTGGNVSFKLYLVNYSDPFITPGPGGNHIVTWGSFELVEAI